jgi:DNA-binding winged helix-turn-helix (wHTH) protein
MSQHSQFKIDPVEQCVWRLDGAGGDERLHLAPEAFQVFHYLLRHPGRIVTHEEFLQAVWPSVHVQPEILKSHILAIRGVLGDRAETSKYIETVRGRGYRFIGPIADFYPEPPDEASSKDRTPFVGREAPLRQLATQLASAAAGEFQAALITGEPGIGKSALVHEFLGAVGRRHGVIASGQCIEGIAGAIEPFYPILEALGSLCKGPLGSTVLRLLTRLAPTWAIQLPAVVPADQRMQLRQQLLGTTHERMLREGCELLESLAGERTIVWVLEDLHWADYASLELFAALCRRRSRVQLMLVGTYRPEDLPSPQHPLHELSQELSLRKLCSLIELPALLKSDLADFLQVRECPEFIDRLFHLCGGNPLFLLATLDHLVDRGLLSRNPGGWELLGFANDIPSEAPATLAKLLEARFARLSDTQRRVLECACVTGMSFNALVSAPAANLDAQDFEEICDELSRRSHFIRHDSLTVFPDYGPSRTWAFNHALYRQVLYGRIGPIRRARLHHAVAQRLEAIYPANEREERAAGLAEHWAKAHEAPRALSYLRLALHTTLRRYAYRDALTVLDHALQIADTLPDDSRAAAQLELLERRAAVYGVTHDARAPDAYALLAQNAAALGDLETQVRAHLGAAYTSSWRNLAESVTWLNRAIELTDNQHDSAARDIARIIIHVRRIWSVGWSSEDAAACEVALESVKRRNDPLATARALVNVSMIRQLSTRYRESWELLNVNCPLLLGSKDKLTELEAARVTWMHRIGSPWCSSFQGELGRSVTEYEAGIAAFERSGDQSAAESLRLYSGMIKFFCMDYRGVLDTCEEVASQVTGKREYPADIARLLPLEHRMSLVFSGLAHLELQDDVAAWKYLEAADLAMRQQPVHLDWYWRLPLEWGMATLLLARDRDAATVHAERFSSLAQATGERMWQAIAFETLARNALAQDEPRKAMAWINQALAASQGYETPHADWRVHRTAAQVHQALGAAGQSAASSGRSMDIRRKLAASLPERHPYRQRIEAASP